MQKLHCCDVDVIVVHFQTQIYMAGLINTCNKLGFIGFKGLYNLEAILYSLCSPVKVLDTTQTDYVTR